MNDVEVATPNIYQAVMTITFVMTQKLLKNFKLTFGPSMEI